MEESLVIFLSIKCLAYFFSDQEQEKPCKSSEYMNLHFKIKWLYSKFIADVPQYKGTVPEYPRLVS